MTIYDVRRKKNSRDGHDGVDSETATEISFDHTPDSHTRLQVPVPSDLRPYRHLHGNQEVNDSCHSNLQTPGDIHSTNG